MYMHILSTIEPEYRRSAALLFLAHSTRNSFLWHIYPRDNKRADVMMPPVLSAKSGPQELANFTTTASRRSNARSEGLLMSTTEASHRYCARSLQPNLNRSSYVHFQ
jgi:hypothetical protein